MASQPVAAPGPTGPSGLGFPVVDSHVHFPINWKFPGLKPEVARYRAQAERRMRAAWGFPDPEPTPEPAEAERRWLAEVERHGLARVVFVTGVSNAHLGRLVQAHPAAFSAYAFQSLTPPEGLAELRRAIEEDGLSGVKVIAPRFPLPFEDESLRPVWEYLAERRLPLLVHFGLLGGVGGLGAAPRMDPRSIHDLARDYPEIPIIVPHFGAGYWQELLFLAWSCPNVHVDTSGSNQWMRWMPYPLDLESLFRKAYETMGPERIIFGTDSSWFPRGFAKAYLDEQVRVCRSLRFTAEEMALIFGGNIARLLKLSLK